MKRCENCDAPLPADSPGGRCPACLMAEAMAPLDPLMPGEFSSVGTDPAPADPLEGASVGPGGRYKILQQIGEGGFGTVYMAEQTRPMRRRVALKILKAGMDTREVVARFEAERQALAMMEHPNIAKVLDGGETEHGRPFFVMELVRGTPITGFCDRERLDPRARLRLFVQVCRAVQHAHQKGVIHRDLKPGNVLVTIEEGAEPVPKVIDFGVAKALETPLTDKTLFTRFEQMVGTPAYMSPEQAAGDAATDIDTRADIYALGVLLYELLTGTTPFEASTLQRAAIDEVRRILREEEAPRPSSRLGSLGKDRRDTVARERGVEPPSLDRQLRGDLDWIVMKAIEKDRRRRYETANGLAVDVERFLADEEVTARPPSTGYRLGKFARRHRPALVTAAVIAAILVAATVVSSLAAFRAAKAEKLAEQRLGSVERERDLKESALEQAKQRRDEALWTQYVARQFPLREALEQGKLGLLEELLGELVPRPEEPDFRGWEWCYLRDECLQRFTTINGGHAVWHPDGEALTMLQVSKSRPSPLELRRPEDGALIRTIARIPAKHGGRMREIRWADDGSRLAYLAGDSQVVVLDAASGEVLLEKDFSPIEDTQFERITGVDLSHEGALLATGSRGGRIEVWDVESGERLRLLQEADWNSHTTTIRFDPSSRHLAAALRFGRRTTWEIDSGEAFEYARQSSGNGRVEWNRSGTRFAATDADSIAVFELHRAEPVGVLLHRGSYGREPVWLGDDQIASAGTDGQTRLWETREFQQVGAVNFGGHLVTGSSGQKTRLALHAVNHVRLFDLEAPSRASSVLSPRGPLLRGGPHFVAWDRNGSRIASAHQEIHGGPTYSTRLRVWSASEGTLLQEGSMGILRGLGWNPDESAVLAVQLPATLVEFGVETGKVSSTVVGSIDKPPPGYTRGRNFMMADFSPDGRWAIFGDLEGVGCLDTRTKEVFARWSSADGLWSDWVRWSNSGDKVAIGKALGGTPRVSVWDPVDKTTVTTTGKDRGGGIHCIGWSPDDQFMVMGRESGRGTIHTTGDLAGKAVLKQHSGDVLGVDWSANGRIATAGADGTVRIWDDSTGDELLILRHPDGAKFFSVRWSPDGRRLAAGGEYGRVFVWGSEEIEPRPEGARGLSTGAIAREPGE